MHKLGWTATLFVFLFLSLHTTVFAQAKELEPLPAYALINKPFSHIKLNEIEYEVIYNGSDNRKELFPSITVFDSPRFFERAWSELNHGPNGSNKAPEIDFQRHWVIMLRPTYLSTGSARTEISNVFRLDESCYALVECTRTFPPDNMMVTCDVVMPVHLIKVPRKTIAGFREITKTAE